MLPLHCSRMNVVFFVLFGAFYTTCTQAEPQLSPYLRECYSNSFITSKSNLLPHNMQTFITILRKIEDSSQLQLDLTRLSVTLLHRFRQDGIIKNPDTNSFAPNGFEYYKGAKILEMIPEFAYNFLHHSLTLIEKCSLHSMLSSSIDVNERGDEPSTCRIQSNQYRSAEELEATKNVSISRESVPRSTCPLASGVISTEWGSIAVGSVLAGLAAGLSFESDHGSTTILDAAWMAAFAGDLAEVALRQGPKAKDDANYTIGVEGHWYSPVSPKYYFMENNLHTEFTAAEFRGGLDGLILSLSIKLYSAHLSSMRLSQIFDMYYSNIGIEDPIMRACNRKSLLPHVLENFPITDKVIRATQQLYPISISISETLRKYAIQATDKFLNFYPSINSGKSCDDTDDASAKISNRLITNLMIFVDTNWPYSSLISILTVLLENLAINKYDSSFTLINAYNGITIIEKSNSILDFYNFNRIQYYSHEKGFNLKKTINILRSLEKQKLNDESVQEIGGGPSNIALIMPYASASISDADKEYYMRNLRTMHQDIPDTIILFLTSGSVDKWSNLTEDPKHDVVSIANGSIEQATGSINNLVNRMRRVPGRFINSQCGASWSAEGFSSAPYTIYMQPEEIRFYRLHPNYFNGTDKHKMPMVNIKGFGQPAFAVCVSRNPLDMNITADTSNCTTFTNKSRISIPCEGDRYLHECKPLYLAIITKNWSEGFSRCNDVKRCRYPKMLRVMISYENLECVMASPSRLDNNSTNSATLIHPCFIAQLWVFFIITISGFFSMNLRYP